MRARVVDASAVAALIHAEREADAVAVAIEGVALIAPRLLAYELDSVCLKKIRVHPGQRDRFLQARALADELGITLLDVDSAGVVALAVDTGLSAYDAAYLWLAGTYEAELVTLDARLQRAARR